MYPPQGFPVAGAGAAIVPVTFVVAASNSVDPTRADYQCTGVNDHIQIQAAIDALPAAGGEVVLLEGTYNVQASINLDSFQTLRGCGRNTRLTTATANLIFLSAVGGAGTEKTHIVISDLQLDGGAGSVSDCGVFFNYVDYSLVQNVYSRRHAAVAGSYNNGIYLENSDFNILIDNVCQANYDHNICLNGSDHNIIVGNTCQGSTGNNGISVWNGSDNNTVADNVCQGNDNMGIGLDTAVNNTIVGNICQGNTSSGIGVTANAAYNTVDGNVCQGNQRHGILVSFCAHNVVSENSCVENSQETNNTYDDIHLTNADYNYIHGNICRAGGLANKPRYGINVLNAACDVNLVTNNDLYNDGFGTAPFNDAGTGTKLDMYVVPFSDGSDYQDSGLLIDTDTEYARAWLRLPDKVVQVVRMKVYARSVVLEADRMRTEFVIYGGADNEAYTTHNGGVANHPSTSLNFAVDDVIFWTVVTAGVLALVGGDSIEVKVLHEVAGNGDCATNAYFRTVEIEYV